MRSAPSGRATSCWRSRGAAAAEIPVAPAEPAEQSESQIRELVARIEAFRREREAHPPAAPLHARRSCRGFSLGNRHRRHPAVGRGRAARRPGRPEHRRRSPGPASMAWTGRRPARSTSARRSATPASTSPAPAPAAGDWRISGVPYFDRAARQLPWLSRHRAAAADRRDRLTISPGRRAYSAPQFPADSLRQLIHELRTPLNAIIGFAEMIEGQYMGPAAAGYRGSAAEIMAQARGLLGAVDDLDTAARLESRRFETEDSQVDAVALLCRLHETYERIAGERGSRIAITIAEGLPPAAGRARGRRADVRAPARRHGRAGRGGRDDRRGDDDGAARRRRRCFASP